MPKLEQGKNAELKRETLKKIKARVSDANTIFNCSWRSHYKEIVDYFAPRIGMYLTEGKESSKDRGKKKGANIINNKASLARRVLASGIQSGLTSHAKPWLSLTVPSFAAQEIPNSVRVWLADVTKIMLQIFADSNFYSVIYGVDDELGTVGTGALLIEEDFTTVVRFRHFTVGEYRLAADSANRVNTLIVPTIPLTVENVVEEYGINNVRPETKDAFEAGRLDEEKEVCCYIGPNVDFGDSKSRLSNSKFIMVEWEIGSDENEYLRISGFKEQPFAVARWQVIGTDVYGSDCPGMLALPEVKQLQVMEKKKLRALDKHVDPPLVAPTSLQNQGVISVAGGVNYVDNIQGNSKLEPAYHVAPDLNGITAATAAVEARIDECFFVQAFVAFMESTKRMTAEEAIKLAAEKLVLLGPVAELAESETLDAVVDRVFAVASRMGVFPPPPPELPEGIPLKIEYLGTLSQAQKLSGATSIGQFLQATMALLQMQPDSAPKLDGDSIIEELAEATGMSPRVLRDSKLVQQIRQQQQAQQQAQMEMMMMQQGAETAKTAAIAGKEATATSGGAV
jgi:hypothetical protein